MTLRTYLHYSPQIASDCYVDESAQIIGRVQLGEATSVWPGVVIRGDVNFIQIGQRTNIQDLSVLHVASSGENNPDGHPLIIGNQVTIGHKVMLHGCTIGHRVLVGMGSIVLDGAQIDDEVMIGAGSLVPPHKHLSSGFLYLGSPAKAVRELTAEEKLFLSHSAEHYVQLANRYQA